MEMPAVTHAPEDESDGGPALLIVDMISDWEFADGEVLCTAAARIAPAIARLKARFQRQGLPVIFANDNRGRWRSNFRQSLDRALGSDGPGARIARLLAPAPEDYFVLKPRHSAFYATPLALLLRDLGLRRLVLAGVNSDQCLAATAFDARMRGFEVIVPRDTTASRSPARMQAALRQFDAALNVRTPAAARLRIAHPGPRRR